MAYQRGEYYLWRDATHMHIWSADGYDGWDESGWAVDEETETRGEGFQNASGVAIPQSVMDEYVVMRLAELVQDGLLNDAVDRARDNGNFGSRPLTQHADRIKAALAHVTPEDA